ncbi:DNA-binding response regulator [Lachnospiraceae bacterium]|nr:DNA-binding response regulator [Lachnospiraceae bacterium]
MPLIYIVEDDVNIREIQRYALKNSGFDVQEFEGGSQLRKAVEQKVPSLVLLDIMLPKENGLSLLAWLRNNRTTAKVPVIMVTAKSSELDKVKGLDQGADDYMTKPFGIMELISRVKALLRRTEGLSEAAVMSNGDIVVDTQQRKVTVAGRPCELTFKEFELLKMLLTNAGIVLSRDKIMDQVWGFDYEGESRTVDMHIKTLRKKLKEAGGAIQTVRNVGYRMDRENFN